jgi:hypothetical protein
MVALPLLLLSLFGLALKFKSQLAAENAALRQQVIVLQRIALTLSSRVRSPSGSSV